MWEQNMDKRIDSERERERERKKEFLIQFYLCILKLGHKEYKRYWQYIDTYNEHIYKDRNIQYLENFLNKYTDKNINE